MDIIRYYLLMMFGMNIRTALQVTLIALSVIVINFTVMAIMAWVMMANY